MSPIAQISAALGYDDVEAILASGPFTLAEALRVAALPADTLATSTFVPSFDIESMLPTVMVAPGYRIGDTLRAEYAR